MVHIARKSDLPHNLETHNLTNGYAEDVFWSINYRHYLKAGTNLVYAN